MIILYRRKKNQTLLSVINDFNIVMNHVDIIYIYITVRK